MIQWLIQSILSTELSFTRIRFMFTLHWCLHACFIISFQNFYCFISLLIVKLNPNYRTPTTTLLQKTKKISVHQQIAYQTLSQVYSVFETKLPVYHYRRLFEKVDCNTDTRSNNHHGINRIEFKLSLCRSNFFYQASRLWASLPTYIKSVNNRSMFKMKCKSWVKENISVKP